MHHQSLSVGTYVCVIVAGEINCSYNAALNIFIVNSDKKLNNTKSVNFFPSTVTMFTRAPQFYCIDILPTLF
jgi:hypothetical protein